MKLILEREWNFSNETYGLYNIIISVVNITLHDSILLI